MRLQVRSLPLLSGLMIQHCIAVSCGVGCRRGSDPALLWLWRGPVAAALIRPLAWEPPYAVGAAQRNSKKTKKKKTIKASDYLQQKEIKDCMLGWDME